ETRREMLGAWCSKCSLARDGDHLLSHYISVCVHLDSVVVWPCSRWRARCSLFPRRLALRRPRSHSRSRNERSPRRWTRTTPLLSPCSSALSTSTAARSTSPACVRLATSSAHSTIHLDSPHAGSMVRRSIARDISSPSIPG